MILELNQLNELISIAVTSKAFRQKLLTNPSLALAEGYQGKVLQLTAQEKAILLRHNANSLQELAKYILDEQQSTSNLRHTYEDLGALVSVSVICSRE